MKRFLMLATAFVSLGCSGTAGDGADGSMDRGSIPKADLIGSCDGTSCDGPGSQGNCWCDDACHDFGDCCGDKPEICGATCDALGGECLSQAGDPGFPALCEHELGRETLPGDCPAFNQACCGGAIEQPDDACEAAGGECLSQPGDPGFPALCESDLGRETLDIDCGAINLACCGAPLEEPSSACEEAGGECLSQPGDPGFPALCESDLGRQTLDFDCGAINLACCGDPV